jgi:hypothetical protein
LTRIRLLSLAAVSILGAGLVAGCGGDDGGDEDPQQVLDETFSNDQEVNSGVIDLSLSGSAEGEEGGSLDASLSGPFQGDASQEGEFPEFDLTASISGEGGGQSIGFEGGLTATADQAFVSYQGTTYEVPKAFYDQIKQAAEQAQAQAGAGQDQDAGAIFDQLGIDPSSWLSEPENEGDEDVEGTETIHIHADANVPRIVEDIGSISEQTGGGQIDEDELAQAEEAIDEASVDVYSGKDDRILRRLTVNLAADQNIEAPSDAQPFSQLEQDLGLPPGLLESALGGGGLGGGGLGGGSLGGGGGGGAGGGGNTDDYAKCLQQAKTVDEINACANQL